MRKDQVSSAVDKRVGAVAQEVEAVGDLDCFWRTLADAVGIGAGPIACDDLDARMSLEPVLQGFRLPVGQQLDGAWLFQVADHCPVVLTTAEGPVIDANHPRCPRRFQFDCPDQAQHCCRAERHRQATGQPGALFAAERQADLLLQVAEPGRPARLGDGHRRQALGEEPARASEVGAAETADPQVQFDRAALPGQIRQPATVGAVPARRGLIAQGAVRGQTGGVRLKDEMGVGGQQTIDRHAGW